MIRVTSFNLRNANEPDGANDWAHRRPLVVEAIRGIDPDVLGTQEAQASQWDDLREALGGNYEVIAAGRDDGERGGEANPLLVRRERFEIATSGTFWLSETPQLPGSKGWDAQYVRICTWAGLRDRDEGGRAVLVLNTHLEYAGTVARRESVRLIRRFIARQGGGGDARFVLTGDFNAAPESDTHAELVKPGDGGIAMIDAYQAVHPTPTGDEATWHGFTGDRNGRPIDWILCSTNFRVAGAWIDRTNYDGRYPSDHFPVTAELEFA